MLHHVSPLLLTMVTHEAIPMFHGKSLCKPQRLTNGQVIEGNGWILHVLVAPAADRRISRPTTAQRSWTCLSWLRGVAVHGRFPCSNDTYTVVPSHLLKSPHRHHFPDLQFRGMTVTAFEPLCHHLNFMKQISLLRSLGCSSSTGAPPMAS